VIKIANSTGRTKSWVHVAMNGIGLVSLIIFGKILVQVNPHRRGIVEA